MYILVILMFICTNSVVAAHGTSSTEAYNSTWESLDSRPLPKWYDEAKIGIFLHWGVFSVPSFGSEWFWSGWAAGNPKYVKFMENNYRPGFTYADFAPMFTAEFYDPEEWAELFSAAGARYIVLTSKHHEGFTMWPSKYSWNWNSFDVGPQKDLLGMLANAIRAKAPHIHFGLYHSMYEWFNPLYLTDKRSKFKETRFVDQKTMPELYELVKTYKPEVIWSDGDWEAPDTYWNSTEFLAWLFNDSPVRETVVVNDRWGRNIPCHHGSFYTCSDRYNPGVVQPHKWENCMTLDSKSWGYRRTAKYKDYLTIEDLLKTIAETISCGGNILINAGPTHDGRIPVVMEERLRQMGSWLDINGQAIYGSKPWAYQNDTFTPGVWYTQNKSDTSYVYAIVLSWPANDTLSLATVRATSKTKIQILGLQQELQIKQHEKVLQISFPPMSSVPSKWAWVLQMRNIKPK